MHSSSSALAVYPDFGSTTPRVERVQVNSTNLCLNSRKQIFRGIDFSTGNVLQIHFLVW